MPTMGMVTPKEWKSRTSVRFGRRNAIAPVDQAYAAYHSLRTEANKKKLHVALTAYLKAKGGYWDKIARNTNSQGLMKYIWEATAPELKKEDLTSPERRGANALKLRIPETRHGALYLWENTLVDTQWGLIFLEGGLSIGASTVNAVGTMQHFKAGDTRALGYTIGSGVGTVGAIGANIAMTAQSSDKVKPLHTSSTSTSSTKPPLVRQNAKLNLRPKPQLVRQNAQINLQQVENHVSNVVWIRQQLGSAYAYCAKKIREFIDWLWFKITSNQGAVVGAASKVVEKIVMIVLGEVAKAAVPLVGSGIDIGRGVVTVIRNTKSRIETAIQRSRFVVSPGHPELIANAIEKQMSWAIGKGVWNVCKGAAKMGAELATAGASTIAAAVAAGIEFATKLILRIVEGRAMNKWVQKVHDVWQVKDNGDPKRPSIVHDDDEFNELFSEGCNASACIPMLTLNSGITGDQMMFMRMFDDTVTMVDQKTFDTATAYFRKLKIWGRDYVQASGFRFTSKKKDVQGLLQAALTYGSDNMSKKDMVLSFLS